MESAVQKRERKIDGMLSAAGPAIKELDVKEEDPVIKVIDMMKPAASLELCPQVVEAVGEVRDRLYLKHSFHNVDLRELVDEQELAHRESLLEFGDLVLSNPLYNLHSGRENANYHYNVLHLESIADADALCKQIVTPQAHIHLFCSALQLLQWYKIIPRAREAENSDGGSRGVIATKDVRLRTWKFLRS